MSLFVFPTRRFLEDTQKDGTPTDKVEALADDLEQAQSSDRHLEAIEGKLRTYRWIEADLGPEYPDRRVVGRTTDSDKPAATPAAARPSGAAAHLGPLTISVFPTAKRINIVSTETGAVARVDLSARSVSSGDVEVSNAHNGTWTLPPWELTVAFAADDSELVIRCGDGEWKYHSPPS